MLTFKTTRHSAPSNLTYLKAASLLIIIIFALSKKNKNDRIMNEKADDTIGKEELLAGINNGLLEVKLIKENQLKGISLEEMLNELQRIRVTEADVFV